MLNIITSPFCMDDILKLKNNGSTSVIVGTPFFSVCSVTHFSLVELKEAKKICVENNLELYILVNRFFMEEELKQLREHLLFLRELDVDGIYFSDMGVFYEAKKIGMVDKLIYNPDTILTNAYDIQAYLDLGLKMCCISKEITLEDIVMIANKIKGNIEMIVQGRLNMMHSKRNLLSNYMEFLNAEEKVRNNTDLYLMEESRDEHMPIIEDEEGTHIYTGFTLCSLEELEDLLAAHISNIRIESMFYTIDDVCSIIKDYTLVAENPTRGRERYEYYVNDFPTQNITKGFLYKKTGMVK